MLVRKLMNTDKCKIRHKVNLVHLVSHPCKSNFKETVLCQNSDFLLTKGEILAPAFYLQLAFLQAKSGNWFSQFLQRFQPKSVDIYGISLSCPESDPLQT
ncbi:hypothetical protein ILYODFUR_028775, partial [Ilyodon furcidens]